MKKILLLLFFVSFCYSADFFTDGWPIYLYGDVQSVEMIFNAIAMIISSDTYQTAIEIVIFLGILVGVYGFIQSGQFSQLFYSATFIVVMIGIMTATPMLSKVHIIDKRVDYGVYDYGAQPNYAVVDNVPIFISLPASFGSLLSYGLTGVVDTATAAIDPDLQVASFSRLGYGENVNLAYDILPLLEFRSSADATSTITGAVAPCDTFNKYDRCLDAYVRTCGDAATLQDINKIDQFTRPGEPLIDSISPTNLGLSGSTSMTFNGVPYTCTNFYNTYLLPSSSPVANTLAEWVNESSNVDIDSPQGRQFLEMTYGLDDVTTTMAGSAGKLEDFFYTFAASKTIGSSLMKSGMGADYTTSDYTSDILNYKALAKGNIEGATMWSFISNVLPLAMHFIMLVAYGVGIFVFLFAFMYGWAKGTMLIGTYMLNIIALSMMMPVLAFVHNLINAYMSRSGLGNLDSQLRDTRMGSMDTITHIGDYMSSMSGVAGFLGTVVIFAIPSLVATGKVSGLMQGAAGALQQMRMRTAGRDAASAMNEGTAAGSQAQQGTGINEAGQKEQIKAQANQLSWGQLTSVDTASSAGRYAGAGQAGSDAGISNFGNSQDSFRASEIHSAKQVGNDTGVATYGNANTAFQAGQVSGAQQVGNDAGLAKSMTANQGYNTSKAASSIQSKQDISMTNARKNEGLIGEDGLATDAAKKSINRNFGMQASEFKGVADAEFVDKDGNSISDKEAFSLRGQASAGQFAEGPIKDAAYIDQTMDNNKLKSEYTDAIHGSESSKIASMKGATDEYGGGDKQASYAETGARAKARGEKSGIDAVGSDAYVSNAGRKAAGDQLGLNKTINDLDDKYGSYEQFQIDNASLMADQKSGLTRNMQQLMGTPEGQEKIEDYVNKAHQQAIKAGRGEDFIQSLKDSTLMDQNGNIQHQNWAYAKSYLQANNMNSHNALVAGGMTFSGALGPNSSVKADGSTSVQHGQSEKFSNDSVQIENTNPQTRAALGVTDTVEEAGAVTAGYDSAKFHMDPKNDVALAAGIAGQKIAGDDADTVAAAGAVVGTSVVAGGGLKALDKATAESNKYIMDADGKPMTDTDGNKIDNPNYKKGAVSKGWGKAKEGMKNAGNQLFGGSAESSFQSDNSSLDEADSTSNNQSNNKNNSHPNDNVHKTPPSSNSNNSIAKSSTPGNSGMTWSTQSDIRANGGNLSPGKPFNPKTPGAKGGGGKWGTVGKVVGSVAALMGVDMYANDNSVMESISNGMNLMDPSSNIMGQPLGDGTLNSPEFMKQNADAGAQQINGFLNGNGVADFSNPFAVKEYANQTGNQDLLNSYNGFQQSQMQNPNFDPSQQSIVGMRNGNEIAFSTVNTSDLLDYQGNAVQQSMAQNNPMIQQPQPLDSSNPLAQYAQQTNLPQNDPLTTSTQNEGMLNKQDTDQHLMSTNAKANQAVSGVKNVGKELDSSMSHLEERFDNIEKEVKRRR